MGYTFEGFLVMSIFIYTNILTVKIPQNIYFLFSENKSQPSQCAHHEIDFIYFFQLLQLGFHILY